MPTTGRRPLSSRQTLVVKCVLPTIGLLGFGVSAGALFLGAGRRPHDVPPPAWAPWMLLGVGLAAASAIRRYCLPLKRVGIDDQALYVSNYLREIRVPLADVDEVSENHWLSFRPITVVLRHETALGRRIVFMPRARVYWPWRPHPVVDELRGEARRAQGLAP